MPAPANDNWADAIPVDIAVDGDTYTATPVDNREATLETGEPVTDPGHDWFESAYRTVWWSYTPSSSGTVDVNTNGSIKYSDSSAGDTVLGVYTGSAVDALTEIAFDDDSGDFNNSAVSFSATSGTTYFIMAGSYNESGSDADIEYHLAVTGPATATPGQITGTTATATATAWPAPYPPVSLNVDGEPATATAAAHPATDVRAYEWAATAVASAHPAKPPNDDFADAYPMTGASGTATLPGLGASREFFEPAGVAAPEDAESLWATYTPTVPGDLTLTVPAGMAAEIWEGDDFLNLVYVAGAATTVTAALAQDITYRIRLSPTIVGATPITVTASWSYTERVAELVVNVDDDQLEDTPTTVRVSVLNGTPDGPVEFTFDGTVIYADVFDASGVIADLELTIPEAPAGVYTLLVTDTTSTDYGTVELTVLDDPLDEPDDTVTEEDPVLDPEVLRWVVQDPHGSTPAYEFPINPKEMSTPFAERTLTTEVTTALDGQPLVWEGARRPHAWQFSGHIETQDHYDALAGYAETNQRWWLIDHRQRAWLLTFEAFEPTLRTRTDPAAPYRSTYVMRCLTYIGPVNL